MLVLGIVGVPESAVLSEFKLKELVTKFALVSNIIAALDASVVPTRKLHSWRRSSVQFMATPATHGPN